MEVGCRNNLLPLEILEEIFKYLSLSDLKACLDVCSTWQLAGSSLYEYHIEAKRKCEEEFGFVCVEGFNKAKLSWPELYNSLNLWANIRNAKISKVSFTPILDNNARSFFDVQCLKDGVIAYVTATDTELKSVTYLDTESFKSKEVFLNVPVSRLKRPKENDDLIVFTDRNNMVYVISKPSYKIHILPEKCCSDVSGCVSFLKDSNIFFYLNENETVIMVSCILENKEAIFKTVKVIENATDGYSPDNITVLSCKEDENGKKIFLLQLHWNYETPYFGFVSDGQWVRELGEGLTSDEIKEHGFDWYEPRIYHQLRELQDINIKRYLFKLKHLHTLCCDEDGDYDSDYDDDIDVDYLNSSSVYHYGDISFIVTPDLLHIAYYKLDGSSKLTLEQTLEIDIKNLFPECFVPEQNLNDLIQDIKIIEIRKGHRLVITYYKGSENFEKRILSIELTH